MKSTTALRLAVAQPYSVLGDVEFNVAEHAQTVRRVQARVVVFPELSLTGYGMDVPTINLGDPVLEPLIDACAAVGSVALAGAPTREGEAGQPRISMLRVDQSGVSVVYSKMHLGGDEPDHYWPGKTPAVLETDGWRLGLAICRDNGQAEHAAATVVLGIDAYIAGACETEDDRNVQPERAGRVIDEHRVWVAYANFAGSTGGGFVETAGRSAVRDPNGTVRLQLGRHAGQCGCTTLSRP